MKPRPRTYDPFATLPAWQPTRMPLSHTSTSQAQLRPSTLAALGASAQRATPPANNSKSLLEQRHPGMASAISLLWGHAEMNDYFDKLWIADGHQSPIDPESMSELMLLAQIHQMLVPRRAPRTISGLYGTAYSAFDRQKRDVWEDVSRRR